MPSLDIVIPAYNAARCLDETLAAVFRQQVPKTVDLGIIVVDNDSTDATAGCIAAWRGRGVRGVEHKATRSRASARNAGVAASSADYVLLVDADCRLVGSDCLGTVGDAIDAGVAAGFGYATGESDSFWGRYHHALEQERGRADWLGWTTQCCLVKREAFHTVGGFCEQYRHYGFEDRDFFCQLRHRDDIGELRNLPELRVYHDPDTTLATVCDKAYEAARYSSGIFLEHFREEYLRLPYAKVDAITAPSYMLAVLRLLGPFSPLFLRVTDALARASWTPLAVGRPLVRLCSALSYYEGTLERSRAG